MLLCTLILLTWLVSLYDLRTRRIPNWVTLPVLLAGVLAHFPGETQVWWISALLGVAFARGWMGTGDVKLWMALIWALPPGDTGKVLPLLLISLSGTALLQMTWRWARRKPITGVPGPAAWRTIPFLLALWYGH